MGTVKTYSYGACTIARFSPAKTSLTPNTKVLNIMISFEEALKLNLAIDECIRKLNKYKRSTTVGKRAALNLALHLNQNTIAIVEDKI